MRQIPVVVCALLYAYYFFAQDVANPVPVVGTLASATCTGGSISQQGAKTSIVALRTTYVFPSRSRDFAQARARTPTQDSITDYVEHEKLSDCEASVLALPKGATRTIGAGENAMSDRFRARLTADRHYPPLALLWGPILFAALAIWGWRRLAASGA